MDVQQLVACPVCTLYLREGMSMHSHLDTHPKDQVIEALVRMYSADRSLGTSFSQTSQSPIVGPFLPVVSEEHIVIGRQQVTSVIHQPIMPYQMYQQQYIPTNHFLSDTECGKNGHLALENSEVDANSSAINLSQVDNYPENVENLTVDNPRVEVEEEVGPPSEGLANGFKSEIFYMANVETAKSPGSPHSCVSIRTVTPERNESAAPCENDYVLSNCNYQDEAARHGDDDTPEKIEDKTEKDGEVNPEEPREPSLQAYERMPPQGELSTTSITSDWIDEDAIEHPLISGPVWDVRRDGPIEERKVEPKIYPCLYCNKQYKSFKSRRLHVATNHEIKDVKKIDGVHVCSKCGSQFSSLGELGKHSKEEHPKVFRKCEVCSEMFPNKEKFTEHLVKVHPLECKVCGKTFHTTSGLSLHSKTHLEIKPHLCHLCPKSFVTPQKLREHLNGHMGISPIQCDLCPKQFKRYSNLKQHKDSAHMRVKKKIKDFFCDCGECFTSKKKLARHQETHTLKPKQCMYCTEKFIHMTSLTRHIRRNHDCNYLPKCSTNKARNVKCPVCNVTCLESSLSIHLKHHSDGRPFSCIICSKRFQTKWNLNVHKWTHTSRIAKPYKCNLCKGAFIRFGSFQAHIRSHLGHKPFTCNHCGLQFIRKQNWQRHEREHNGHKTYSCSECGKSFYRSYYLTEHLRVHSGVKPYSCHICSKLSATKSNHNKHLKTHHARETINTEG